MSCTFRSLGALLAAAVMCAAPASAAVLVDDFELGLSLWQQNPTGGLIETRTVAVPPMAAGAYLYLEGQASDLPTLFRPILVGSDNLVLQFVGGADFTNAGLFSEVAVVVMPMDPGNIGGTVNVGLAGSYSIPLSGPGQYLLEVHADPGGQADQAVTAWFDSFTLIPEPSALIMLVAGITILVRPRRTA